MGKRSRDRVKRRAMVRYGVEKADHTAFTKDLSLTGLSLKTNHVFKPGVTVLVEVRLGEETYSQWARVVWAKKVPPQLAHVLNCGMGLRFVEPDERWLTAFRTWSGSH